MTSPAAPAGNKYLLGVNGDDRPGPAASDGMRSYVYGDNGDDTITWASGAPDLLTGDAGRGGKVGDDLLIIEVPGTEIRGLRWVFDTDNTATARLYSTEAPQSNHVRALFELSRGKTLAAFDTATANADRRAVEMMSTKEFSRVDIVGSTQRDVIIPYLDGSPYDGGINEDEGDNDISIANFREVDLPRFCSGLLRAMLSPKETGYGSDTRQRQARHNGRQA